MCHCVLRHPDVALQRVVERRARLLLDLRVEDAVDAAVVALLAVEIAVHRLGEERVHHLVLLLLRDQDVDVELGAKARDPLHQLQRRHLQRACEPLAVRCVARRVQRVVDDHRLDVAVRLRWPRAPPCAVVTPVKPMPSGLSRCAAAALSPLTNSRRTRCSSLMTRMRLTGLHQPAQYNFACPRPGASDSSSRGLPWMASLPAKRLGRALRGGRASRPRRQLESHGLPLPAQLREGQRAAGARWPHGGAHQARRTAASEIHPVELLQSP